MSGLVLFGLLWGAIGFALGIQWWRARLDGPQEIVAGAAGPSGPLRFGADAEDRSHQRARAMLASYSAGALCCAVGFPARADAALALGALLVNVGTVYRYLSVALDRTNLDLPLFDLEQPSRVPA